jgi:hypothetical protein
MTFDSDNIEEVGNDFFSNGYFFFSFFISKGSFFTAMRIFFFFFHFLHRWLGCLYIYIYISHCWQFNIQPFFF